MGRLDTEAVAALCADIARCIRDDDAKVCLAAMAIVESRFWGPQHRVMIMPEVELRLNDTNDTIRRAAMRTMKHFGGDAVRTMKSALLTVHGLPDLFLLTNYQA